MDAKRARFLFLYYAVLLLAVFAFVRLVTGEPALPSEKEAPLVLNSSGYVAKFLAGWWEVGVQDYDVDGDGTIDWVVWVGTRNGHTVGIVHDYGADPDRYGPAVFYSIKDGKGEIVEWAGDPSWPQHPPKRP